CFPQFAALGPLQKHGFARTKPWQLISAEQGTDDALAVLRLTDDEATRMLWPHAFELELSVRVFGRDLAIELACENKGETTFEFTAALHTYLGLNSLLDASVRGLSGLKYADKVKGSEARQRVDLLLPDPPLDRIYYEVQQGLALIEQPTGRPERHVAVRHKGFTDAVVWNPGAEGCKQLQDMPADGWQKMLCIEAAVIAQPVRLAAGESWLGMQSLVAGEPT
ncbi:MAG TPA: D-hexose-6-phosphate mutarotase, partial [Burkholderiaceae bacterium]